MFKMSSFCFHASPKVLALLCNSIVDNPLIIHSRGHTRLHPSHIMASEQSRFNPAIIKCGAWCKNKSTTHQSLMLTISSTLCGMCGWLWIRDYLLFRKCTFLQMKFKHSYLFIY